MKNYPSVLSDENIWQDKHTGGWIAEVLSAGEWIHLGYFSTWSAAFNALRESRS